MSIIILDLVSSRLWKKTFMSMVLHDCASLQLCSVAAIIKHDLEVYAYESLQHCSLVGC
jgi:hypothetical protein